MHDHSGIGMQVCCQIGVLNMKVSDPCNSSFEKPFIDRNESSFQVIYPRSELSNTPFRYFSCVSRFNSENA